jgi:hypothetical protein
MLFRQMRRLAIERPKRIDRRHAAQAMLMNAKGCNFCATGII